LFYENFTYRQFILWVMDKQQLVKLGAEKLRSSGVLFRPAVQRKSQAYYVQIKYQSGALQPGKK